MLLLYQSSTDKLFDQMACTEHYSVCFHQSF